MGELWYQSVLKTPFCDLPQGRRPSFTRSAHQKRGTTALLEQFVFDKLR
jgi:hypothetical protein